MNSDDEAATQRSVDVKEVNVGETHTPGTDTPLASITDSSLIVDDAGQKDTPLYDSHEDPTSSNGIHASQQDQNSLDDVDLVKLPSKSSSSYSSSSSVVHSSPKTASTRSAAVGASIAGDDAASVSNISLQSQPSTASASTMTRTHAGDFLKRTASPAGVGDRATTQLSDVTASSVMQSTLSRSSAANASHSRDKNAVLASIIRRNYIYFTSLLQEPEAKWKHFSDSRGVTLTQLDSIDPTLVVYRAEATFVGVGIRDLYAAIASPGVKNSWDRGAEQTTLLQDLGDASKLWWHKTRATWPVASRDAVLVETAYKSPESIHVFSFSTDDKKLFSAVPSPELGAIRTQIDLRGWSIESLSPTTSHVTLIEQSDPKGWTSKASATPAAMTAAVAGIGDFAIKQGAPPMATRLRGARMKTIRYENEKSLTRLEYDLSVPVNQKVDDTHSGNVECEIRCDVDVWSPSLDVIVDPPPLNVRCVRRHKLSPAGGGMYITIEQATASLEDDASRITIRKANNKEKGVVYVNGARMKTEVEDLKDEEETQLREQKRTKPRRTPLDLASDSPRKPLIGSSPPSSVPVSRTGTPANNTASISATSSNLAAITGQAGSNSNGVGSTMRRTTADSDVFSDEHVRKPMKCALDVLYLLRRIHAERSPDPAGTPAGWSLVSQRGGMFVRRKLMQSISPTIVVQRSDKVVEGLTAENILDVVSDVGCRRLWDDKVDTSRILESYGSGASTGIFTTKASFPFRGRAFHVAGLTARSGPDATQVGLGSSSSGAPTVYFHASSSYSEQNVSFSSAKINPASLPVGRVLIDGWIMETLDPYSSTLNYQIPSTRVTHLIAVDYAGSLPVAVNAMWNTQLSRGISMVEEYLKTKGSLPAVRCPPFAVEVLGDGRDDDHDLVWSLTDDEAKRGSTLLSSEFDPVTRRYDVLCTLNSRTPYAKDATAGTGADDGGLTTPLAMPFPRRAQATSSASTTRGLASAATTGMMSSSPSRDSLLNEAATDVAAKEYGFTSSMSRTTSVNSLRSTGSKSRLSVTRKDAVTRKPNDLVVVDVEVDLRHYDTGYGITVLSEFGQSERQEANKKSSLNEEKDASEKQSNGNAKDNEQVAFPEVGQTTKDDTTSQAVRSPWDLSAPRQSDETVATLPVVVSAFDMPPSAVLAATLDPSARPKKHLVRIALPTASFLETSRINPFYGPEPDDAPTWYTDARKRGALVRVVIEPHGQGKSDTGAEGGSTSGANSNASSPNPSSTSYHGSQNGDGELDSQQVPVYYKGEQMSVTHVNKTSAMLQRESENEQAHAVLKRITKSHVPPRIDDAAVAKGSMRRKSLHLSAENAEDGTPLLLRKPLAAAMSLKADLSETQADSGRSKGPQSVDQGKQEQAKSHLTPSSSGEVGDLTTLTARGAEGGVTPRGSNNLPSSKLASTPTPASASTTSPTSAASAQIMSILNAYPLSRLGGASTAVSTTVANGGVFSRKGGTDGREQARAGDGSVAVGQSVGAAGTGDATAATAANGTADDESLIGGVPGQLIEATEQIRKRIVDVKFNLSTLILVALIAFLLGSLVRSLLEPADFVLVKKLTGEAADARKNGVGGDGLQAIAVRELKQMLLHGHSDGGSNDQHAHSTTTVAWRELRRLIEVRNLFGGRWDLVIAAARR